MAILTALDRVDLGALLAQYGVRATALLPTEGGVENTNYFVTDATRQPTAEFVLTLVESPVEHGDWIVPAVLDAASAAGLPTPRLLRALDGRAVLEWNGRAVLLCTRVPGTHRDRVNASDCAAVGRFVALFHRATASLVDRAPAHPRNVEWLQARIDRFEAEDVPWRHALFDEAMRIVRETATRIATPECRKVVVHGDLFRDNALFEASRLSGVIDFHHAARHCRGYDLAVIANDWCTDALGVLDVPRVRALLTGYVEVSPLHSLELALLPQLRIWAALAFALSRLEGERARPDYGKSALPMLQRLRSALARPWPLVRELAP